MTLNDIIARAERGGMTVGASTIAPDGRRFSHNGTRAFVAASTVKIAVMVELFRQVDAGGLTLAQDYRLRTDDKAEGSGVLLYLHPGMTLTLGDLAYLMMSISDNTATNVLIDRLRMERIGDTMRDLGMRSSVLRRRMVPPLAQGNPSENWATPDDYVSLVLALFQGRAASAAACARMVALLETQQNDRRIARFLPRVDRPRWGSKTGTLPGIVNDVGFVMTLRGPLIVAVFCAGVADPLEGERVIGEITRAALDAESRMNSGQIET